MDTHLQFNSRNDFRNWLIENNAINEGIWLIFGKAGAPITIKPAEALEEALCFGWIDGQMKSIDEKTYIKYFSQRRKGSNWSEKNKNLAEKLEQQGIMTDHGRAKIEEAKSSGKWEAPKAPAVTDEQITVIIELLAGHEPAYTNFIAMSPSVKKTYTRAYFDAKTAAGQEKRLSWMIERLNNNLKPM